MASIINALTASGGGVAISGDATGNLALQSAGNTAVTIDTSQNVGIGTTSPAVKCHVSSSAGVALRIDNPSGTSTGLQSYLSGNLTSAVDFSTSGTIFYQNAGSGACPERMRVDSNGILWVGASSGAWQGRLSIESNSDTSYYPIAINNTASGTGSFAIQDFYRNGTRTGTISATGTTTAYNTSSDYRLKKDVQPMTNALTTVSALKPVTFKWKLDGSSGQGFIAHELAEIVPEAVSGEKDGLDKNGNPNYQGVDVSFLVATLTAAIQELNAKVEAQAAEIAALKGAK